jgi:hypothetical protein
MKELGEFEKTKTELRKLKRINKNLKKKLDDNSLEFSDIEG